MSGSAEPRDRGSRQAQPPASPLGAVVVVGEALVDVVPAPDGGEPRDLPGGSPANVAVTLGRLGRAPVLVTSLADDARGVAVRAWLEASGVHVVADAPSTGRTSAAVVRLAEDGSASYEFDLAWEPAPATLAGVTSADGLAVLHAGSIATVLEPGADAVEAAMRDARGRALVSFDPNARPAITPDVDAVRGRVERLVGLSDVVKVSEEDLGWYYPEIEALDAARRWAAAEPALVVVTFGGDGCALVRGDESVRVSGRTVEVADTIGAGDTFMGALLDALLGLGVHGPGARDALQALDMDQLRSAAAWAASAAAITVSRPGADPPTRAELEAATS